MAVTSEGFHSFTVPSAGHQMSIRQACEGHFTFKLTPYARSKQPVKSIGEKNSSRNRNKVISEIRIFSKVHSVCCCCGTTSNPSGLNMVHKSMGQWEVVDIDSGLSDLGWVFFSNSRRHERALSVGSRLCPALLLHKTGFSGCGLL